MKLRIGLVAASLFAAIAASPAASAMPLAPAPQVSSGAEQVRLVCDAWGRCWRQPSYYYGYGYAPYYAPRYYGPRYYGPRYYGWRRW
ncbi:hypothetical protein QA640_26880 [Bradyrhizobium sp. CB82]|uniref:hypothetical protein n=1 Tax=Bradyrhizobium sp. CB82 TaxID=3039159 RepID=UPI0024B1F417|nr:hypothetical protein [Bradyrhizobium sp. CB82]WFU38052.1 hypothetical protein QA640_26880 [Bradyrhizobium sp. CB82]